MLRQRLSRGVIIKVARGLAAIMLATGLLLVAFTPFTIEAASESQIVSQLKGALLKQSDLLAGFPWKAEPVEVDTRSQSNAIWGGDITVSTGWNGEKDPGLTSGQSRSIGCRFYYASGQNTLDAFCKTVDTFRAYMVTRSDVGGTNSFYDGLPGGVANDYLSASSGGLRVYDYEVIIFFWVSPNYWGQVSSRISLYTNAEAAKTAAYPECERLAQIAYTRLALVAGAGGGGPSTGGVAPPPISSSALPDGTLPLATGATSLTTILLTLAALRAQGYSPAEALEMLRGLFRRPTIVVPQVHDGDTDASGNIWSDYAGGWVDTRSYDYWRNAQRQAAQAQEVNRDLAQGQSAYVKEVYDGMLQAKGQLEAAEQQIRDTDSFWAKEDAATARYRQLLRESQEQGSWQRYIQEVYQGFGEGLGRDLYDVADAIRGTGEAFARTADAFGRGVQSAYDTVTNPESYQRVYETVTDPDTYLTVVEKGMEAAKGAAHTAADVALHPFETAREINDFVMAPVKSAASFTLQAGGQMVMHPMDTAKAVLGVDNWEKVMDPDVPIVERLGRALYGAVDTSLTITTFGGSKLGLKGAEAAVETLKVVDGVSDAGKATGAAHEVAQAGRVVKEAEAATSVTKQANRVEDFRLAREAGQTETKNFVKSYGQALETQQQYHKQYDDARAALNNPRLNPAQKAAARDVMYDAGSKLAKADNDLKEATIRVNGSEQAKFEAKRAFDEKTGTGFKTEHTQAYNDQLKKVYDETDRRVVKDLSGNSKYGEVVEDTSKPGCFVDKEGQPRLEVAKPTNPSAKPKVSLDQDVTYRRRAEVGQVIPDPKNPNQFIVKVGEQPRKIPDPANPGKPIIEYKDQVRVPDPQKPGSFIIEERDPIMVDVKPKEIADIHAAHYYEVAKGEKAPDIDAARRFAKEQGQVVTDRLHSESYGRGARDLEVATGKPSVNFSDPQQVGKAIGYKSHDLYFEAQKIRATEPLRAESLVADGIRQSTKQWDNQLLPRLTEISQKFAGKNITPPPVPPRLSRAIEIMRDVETKGTAPATIEGLVRKETDLSLDDVAAQLGEFVEALQRIKPWVPR